MGIFAVRVFAAVGKSVCGFYRLTNSYFQRQARLGEGLVFLFSLWTERFRRDREGKMSEGLMECQDAFKRFFIIEHTMCRPKLVPVNNYSMWFLKVRGSNE